MKNVLKTLLGSALGAGVLVLSAASATVSAAPLAIAPVEAIAPKAAITEVAFRSNRRTVRPARAFRGGVVRGRPVYRGRRGDARAAAAIFGAAAIVAGAAIASSRRERHYPAYGYGAPVTSYEPQYVPQDYGYPVETYSYGAPAYDYGYSYPVTGAAVYADPRYRRAYRNAHVYRAPRVIQPAPVYRTPRYVRPAPVYRGGGFNPGGFGRGGAVAPRVIARPAPSFRGAAVRGGNFGGQRQG